MVLQEFAKLRPIFLLQLILEIVGKIVALVFALTDETILNHLE